MPDNDVRDSEGEDPFKVLVANVTKILAVLERSEVRASTVARARSWQIKRTRRALVALTAPPARRGGERTQAQIDGTERAKATRRRNRDGARSAAIERHEDREEATVG